MKKFSVLIFAFCLSVSTLCLAQTDNSGQSESDILKSLADMAAMGQFSEASSLAEMSGMVDVDSAVNEARTLLNDYIGKRKSNKLENHSELQLAVKKTTRLTEIAGLNENSNGQFSEVRDKLDDIRKIIVDLLAAAKVEENITSDSWMQLRVSDDKLAISSKLHEIRALLGAGDQPIPQAKQETNTAVQAEDKNQPDGDIIETAPQTPVTEAKPLKPSIHTESIITATFELMESLTKFEDEAKQYDWSTAKSARDSLDKITDTADELAASMDWLSALVSEMPWREALDKLLTVRMIAVGDSDILETPWALQAIKGAEAQAQLYGQEGEYYKALSLYNLLETIFVIDNDNRYLDDINRVKRQAVMMSLYARPDEEKYNENIEDMDKSFEQILADHEKDWQDHIRGVDFNMASIILARINESYVKTPDFSDLLEGGISSIETMLEIPRIDQTFTGLQDDQARQEFITKLQDYRQQAADAPQLDYKMVALTLNMILRVNQRTVKIPQEVIDIEFTNGVLDRLDKFSTMIWPNEWKEFRKQITGNFKGVGIQIQYQQETDYISVISPLENSPAYRAGIQAGDLIIKVDGQDAKGLDTDEAIDIITGPAGTKVTLTIKRPGRKEPIEFELTRQEINVQTVKGWKRTTGENWDWMIDHDFNIGYVRLTHFTAETVPALRTAIMQMKQDNVGAIILDMRGNPGGMLPAAIGVTDEFVKDGTIVSTRGRGPEESASAQVPGGFEKGPMVVLVDENSASAAEIVSGALKDLKRATIVGRRSYGKGSVQNLMPVRPGLFGSSDAHLKLTTAYYYLPSGRCLHRLDGQSVWGVQPDLTVAMTPKQVRRWLLMRRRTEIIKNWDADQLDEDMQTQLQYDLQLQAALLLCRLQLLAGPDSHDDPTNIIDTNIATAPTE